MGEKKMRRKIRIMYNDPDATESSSSDEDEKLSNGNKVVREIEIPIAQKIEKKENNKKKSCLKQEANNSKKSSSNKKSSSKFKGVRRRPSGNYGAEITHPTTKKKIWLGTFVTRKEAAAAYSKKEEEFNKLRMAKSGEKEEEESDGLSTFSSPSSVLDITNNRTSISERVKLSFTVVKEEVSVVDLFEVPLLSPSANRELLDLFDAPERYSHSASFEVSFEKDEAFKECNDVVQGDYEFEQQHEEGEGGGGEKGVIFTDICAEESVSPSASHELLLYVNDSFDAAEIQSHSASVEVSIKEDEAFKECNNVVQFVQGDYEFEQQQGGGEKGVVFTDISAEELVSIKERYSHSASFEVSIKEAEAFKECNLVVKFMQGDDSFEQEEEKGLIFTDICAEELVSPSISEKYLDFGYDEFGEVLDKLGYEEGCCMVEKSNILDWPANDDNDVKGFSDIESFILSI